MIDTILFDLDGTLVRFTQKAFIDAYFGELAKVFGKMGMDINLSIKAVWAGTKSMFINDGTKLNSERFWHTFAKVMELDGERLKTVEAACDSFYTNEFNTVKSIIDYSDIPKRLVRGLAQKGYKIALATNPLFPKCAVESRLGWIGLAASDFIHITHYSNSKFCKPHLGYYKEILQEIGKTPEQCIMVGNNPSEDMIPREIGMETYLVTDYMENESDTDITTYRKGTLAEMETTLMQYADCKGVIAG